MNLFWMSGPQISKTWIIISRKMVGSTTSLMRRTSRWRKTGCLGEILVKRAPSSSLLFSPPSRTRTTLLWIGNVALVGFSFLCLSFLCYLIFLMLTFLHFVLLGGSIIACHSIQHHIVALELDIYVFKSILLPMREPEQKHTAQHAAPQRGLVFAPEKMAKRNFNFLCA